MKILIISSWWKTRDNPLYEKNRKFLEIGVDIWNKNGIPVSKDEIIAIREGGICDKKIKIIAIGMILANSNDGKFFKIICNSIKQLNVAKYITTGENYGSYMIKQPTETVADEVLKIWEEMTTT